MSSRKRPTTTEILSDLAKRPALNGGFDKLASQQDEQCERLERLEARFDRLDRWARWLAGAAGTVALSVVGRLVYDLVSHVHIVVH